LFVAAIVSFISSSDAQTVMAETNFSEYGALRHLDLGTFRPLEEDCNFVSNEFGSFEDLLPNKFYEERDFKHPAWLSFLGTGYKVFSDITLICDGQFIASTNDTSPRPNESTSAVFDWHVFLADYVDWLVFSDNDTAMYQTTHTSGPKRNIGQNTFKICSIATITERKWRRPLRTPVDPAWRECSINGILIEVVVVKKSPSTVRDGKCGFHFRIADGREPRIETDIRLSTKMSIFGIICRNDTERFAVPKTEIFSKFIGAALNSLER
jgi:hypothetical protein